MEKNYKKINSSSIQYHAQSVGRLADTNSTLRDGKEETEKMKKNNKVLTINSTLVTIDEDEKECLRRLAENKNDQPLVGFNQKLKLKDHDNNKSSLESKKSLDINESAEKFIQNFKQQLLLQRLQSIENVDNIIARGL
ncbi:unnamed protein product [Amaranthus hypochondriacus]